MKKSEKIPNYQEVTNFHGHKCPGTAIGYRAGEIAINELSRDRTVDEEFLAIMENDSCSVDAVQVVTGCTSGNGNLIFKDYGKQVYTFMNQISGEAIRISLKIDLGDIKPNFSKAREKVLSGTAGEADKKDFEKQKEVLIKKILEMPASELFNIERVEMESPEMAIIYKSLKCAECGELVSEHRARVKQGRIVCIPCFN